MKDLWVEKYRPNSLDDYMLDKATKDYFSNMLKEGSVQNMTFMGPPGSGKTTLAKIICKTLNAEVLFIPCSDKGQVDTIRLSIKPFCDAMSLGRPKIVVLDEIDSASSSSADNNFQKALRALIEDASTDTRFILTCNYPKVIPPLISRCPVIPLTFTKKDLLVMVVNILNNEGIKYTKKNIKTFIDVSFKYYPDARKIINMLQFCCGSGELVVQAYANSDTDKELLVKDIVSKCMDKNVSIFDVRQMFLQKKELFPDMLDFGSLMFNYVANNDMLDVDGYVDLSDKLYQLNVVVDKEPTVFAMMLLLRKYSKNG